MSLPRIDIKGKAYVLVSDRIKHFHETYKDGSIISELLLDDDGRCVFKATIYVAGETRATGHAYEKEGSSFINKTSYLENCETSAIGRALGIFGIGIDDSVASYEEVANAIQQQNEPPKTISEDEIRAFQVLIKEAGMTVEEYCKLKKIKSLKELTDEKFEKLYDKLAQHIDDQKPVEKINPLEELK